MIVRNGRAWQVVYTYECDSCSVVVEIADDLANEGESQDESAAMLNTYGCNHDPRRCVVGVKYVASKREAI